MKTTINWNVIAVGGKPKANDAYLVLETDGLINIRVYEDGEWLSENDAPVDNVCAYASIRQKTEL